MNGVRVVPESIPQTIQAKTVAARLDVSKSVVRKWHKAGLIRGAVVGTGQRGGVLLIDVESLRVFLASRGISIAAEP